jgi:hypothetical protein
MLSQTTKDLTSLFHSVFFKDVNPSNIIAISPVAKLPSSSRLNTGAIVAITIAVVIFGGISAFALFIFFRMRKAKRAEYMKKEIMVVEGIDNDKYLVEIHGKSLCELSPVDVVPEMTGSKIRHELPSKEKMAELSADKPSEGKAKE